MKFSIVTPTYNSEKYLKETIESVISQVGDFEIEYIVVDGNSTDSTIKIVEEYESKIRENKIPILCNKISLKHISEKDGGVYDAINKGFGMATGNIYAWIGSDDIYEIGTAFNTIATWFNSHTESKWIKGMCGLIDIKGNKVRDGRHRIFYKDWILEGVYGRETYFIEQESVFWKPELWKKVAPIPKNFRFAGDYWLWIQFAKHSPLESIPIEVASFRVRPGQISSNTKQYKSEQHNIRPYQNTLTIKVRIFSILWNKVKFLSSILKTLHPLIFDGKKVWY